MTTPTITCEQFSDGLSDLLERDADEATRARLEAHALSCSERSEERRVGKECEVPCRSRWSPYH